VVQGENNKLRAIDEETRCLVNSTCEPAERLSHDRLDALVVVMRALYSKAGVLPMLWKADVDAAVRRVLIKPQHRFAAWVAFIAGGERLVAQHFATPFGSIASVHAWERIGAMICHVARRVLWLPLLRYVDDFFAADHPECAEHSMHCFARLTRCMLGSTAIAARKLECGAPLVILGLKLDVSRDGITCWPSEDKVVKWSAKIDEALNTSKLPAGEASKLAGALSWAGQNVFRRLGRALLRPLFWQAKCKSGRISKPLRLALQWWMEVLRLQLRENIPWQGSDAAPIEIFADARSTPPRVAAVMFADGESYYCDLEPSEQVVGFFEKRGDGQIMSLELLSIALALSSFAPWLQRRKVRIWSDNKGAEGSLRKGSAKKFDHTCLVHALWHRAAQLQLSMFIDRVPTDDNIADLPSREDYRLLQTMRSKQVIARLDPMFCDPAAWNSLSVKAEFLRSRV
jgi:hypothetical protein